eukprot:gene9437-1643_t
MTQQLLLLLLVLFFHTTKTQEFKALDCLLWENSYVAIDVQKVTNAEDVLIFSVRSRQQQGWMSIGFFSKPNNFEDSISVVAFLPNNFIQLTNHTNQVQQKIIFDQTFQKRDLYLIDGVFAFSFKINSSHITNKNFIMFAQQKSLNPTIVNETTIIPRHQSISGYQYFNRNNSKSIPICIPELNLSGRIVSQHYIGFILGLCGYILLGILYLVFRKQQPFKSRFIGPFVVLISLTISLTIEHFIVVISFEKHSPIFCFTVPYISFGSLQVA